MSLFIDNAIAWGNEAAPYLIAIPMAIFGVQHFIYLDFVANFIPAWIPWRTFWACFTGAALVAAAMGIVFRIGARSAATWLGVMILLWVLLLHTSRIASNPSEFAEWRGFFQALAMSGCAFALAQRRVAPFFIGVSMIALGIEHFIFTTVAAPQVPVWISGTRAGNYLSGAALLLLGVGICWPGTRRLASAWLGIMIFLSMLFVHLPVVFQSLYNFDWTKTLVMSGGAFVLASVSARKEKPSAKPALESLASCPAS